MIKWLFTFAVYSEIITVIYIFFLFILFLFQYTFQLFKVTHMTCRYPQTKPNILCTLEIVNILQIRAKGVVNALEYTIVIYPHTGNSSELQLKSSKGVLRIEESLVLLN